MKRPGSTTFLTASVNDWTAGSAGYVVLSGHSVLPVHRVVDPGDECQRKLPNPGIHGRAADEAKVGDERSVSGFANCE